MTGLDGVPQGRSVSHAFNRLNPTPAVLTCPDRTPLPVCALRLPSGRCPPRPRRTRRQDRDNAAPATCPMSGFLPLCRTCARSKCRFQWPSGLPARPDCQDDPGKPTSLPDRRTRRPHLRRKQWPPEHPGLPQSLPGPERRSPPAPGAGSPGRCSSAKHALSRSRRRGRRAAGIASLRRWRLPALQNPPWEPGVFAHRCPGIA